jgi:hypothetical protein
MKTNLEIIQEFSYMFSYDDFPFECDTGWNENIYNCLKEIAKIDKDKYVKIIQIKEKFGWLRIYHEFDDMDSEQKNSIKIHDKINKIVNKYEEKTLHICEVDGDRGNLHRKGYWYKTLCKECAKEMEYVPVNRKIVKAELK